MVSPKSGQFPHFEETHDPAGFRSAILSAKLANKNGASVDVHSQEEYSSHKMFTTRDKMAGYSVSPQGELVSVFKHPASSYENVAQRAAEHGTLVGGANHLNAYDGKLPEMYAKGGFKASSRLPWNEEFKPEGWKGGSPDVVMMHALPHVNRKPYSGTHGKQFEDWDAAESHTKQLATKSETRQKSVVKPALKEKFGGN